MGKPIYVEVRANSPAARTMNLTASSGGVDQGGYFLYWNSDTGFTDGNVLWGAMESFISETGWQTAYSKYGFDQPTWDNFTIYLATGPSNLDDVLGHWPSKGQFVEDHIAELGIRTDNNPRGCLSFTE